MKANSTLCAWFAATVLCGLTVLTERVSAQSNSTPSVTDSDRNAPSYTISADAQVTIRPDLTAAINNTIRVKVLSESAIRTLAQQTLSYVESLNPLEVVEAYTEK